MTDESAFIKTLDLGALYVSFGRPNLIAKSHEYLWFPALTHLSNGDLLAHLQDHPDMPLRRYHRLATWSHDDGETWSEPFRVRDSGFASLCLPGGESLLLPYVLEPLSQSALGAPYNVICPQTRTVRHVRGPLVVTGWPRPVHRKWVTNKGCVTLEDGTHLITLHGYFGAASRASLVVAESANGVNWKIRSVIADERCDLEGGDGPSEADLCCLGDGRLMCVFRLSGWRLFGQSFSEDEGHTWTTPIAMTAFSVQPSLVTMADGTVVLSGGRPGLYLWFDAGGRGEEWQRVDVLPIHNAACSDQLIEYEHAEEQPAADGISNVFLRRESARNARRKRTSSYTQLLPIGENRLLYIYDRIPNGWNPIAPGSQQTNSVWLMTITVRRKDQSAHRNQQMIRIRLNHPYTNDRGETYVVELLPDDEVPQAVRIGVHHGDGRVSRRWLAKDDIKIETDSIAIAPWLWENTFILGEKLDHIREYQVSEF